MKLKIYVSGVLFVFMCCFSLFTMAQTKLKVQGVVKSSSGEALPGVSVTIKDATQGTLTNANGEFNISVEKGKILIFKYLGFKTIAQGVNAAGTLNITMEESVSAMDEVVVIGYGTQKKSSVTGAVSKLVNTNLDEIPTSRLDNALIGKIAGVTIQNVTSEAGQDPVVRIRGFSSISANSQPLVVVDGYPVPDGLSFVNPQDVASVEVLKDAASAAIYGSRAANGVILITTKSGNSDKPKYQVKTYYGTRNPYELIPLLTFSEYMEGLYREAALRENDPSVPANKKNLATDAEKASYVIENEIANGPTDWQQVALQNASIYNMQLSLSGGKKELKYYLSGSYQKEEGAMKFSENTRATAKAKVSGELSKKIKFNFNFNPSYVGTTRPGANYTDYYRFASFIPVYHNEFTAAFARQNPQWANVNAGDYFQARHFADLNYSGYMPDGTLWTSNGTVVPFATNNNTPFSIANRISDTRVSYRMLGGGDISFEIIPKLIFKTSIGGYYTNQDDLDLTKSDTKQDGAVNEAIVGNRVYKDVLWENTLNYDWKIKKHSFTGLVGYTAQQTWINNSQIVGRDFPADKLETLNQAAQIDQDLTYTLKDRIGLLSYLGRLTYDYDNKYLLTATFRTDGSSYFAKGNKWGYFPSASVGWLVSNEKFMQDVNWISNLKLRTSYGATGNNRINSFAFQNLLYPANYAYGAGSGNVSLGLSPNSNLLANPDITWERTFEYNSGIDIGFLKNRFGLTLEYYSSITDRLLYNQAAMSFSGSNEFINNAGKVRNRGLELEITSNNIKTKNFQWSTSINASGNRNVLLELGGEPAQYNFGERNEVYAAIVGQPAIQFYGYKTDGVWTSQAQIDEAVNSEQTTTISRYYTLGGLKIEDKTGDNKIDMDDRQVLGSPFPDFLWGISNNFKYKNFDLSVLIQGSQGGKLIDGDPNYNETRKYNKNFNNGNRWLSEMYPGDGKTPYYTNGINWLLTDYVIEDASYASLRNVILGYTLPKNATKKIGVSALRLYASADNLLYFMGKGYKGINPEARTTSSAYASPLIDGYQRGAFPVIRSFTFGLDLSF